MRLIGGTIAYKEIQTNYYHLLESVRWAIPNGVLVDYFTGFNFPFNFEFSPLQTIERSWKTAKERNKGQDGTHRSMIDSYMCEYMWRNRVK